VEKNLRAFLELDIPGTKVVVGDGPDLKTLKEDYPGVSFRGSLFGEDLALMYANADVFVFPSRTDTFGIVMLEAMASGLPVAAYKVPGPEDVVMDGVTGCLREDLKDAVYGAIGLKREDCRAAAIQRSWNAATEQFLSNLHFHAFPFSRVEPQAV
ncbi:MAG TPA: glycosyltransferase, partial [Synergistales bacterium]|nr:glycosyltransferase [Synergistales bacterium]